MAAFQGWLHGQKGAVSRLGSKNSGLVVQANGWTDGVKVVLSDQNGVAKFEVYRTGGSNGGRQELIASWLDSQHSADCPRTNPSRLAFSCNCGLVPKKTNQNQ